MTDFLIPESDWEYMTPGQKTRYRELLKRKKAMDSPLDYALYVSPKKVKRYRHTEYLNSVVLALVEKRLYASGPGPSPVWVDISDEMPRGRPVHPETGEPALFKLMISLPPRIGKSFFLGEMFSAWYLSKYPDETIMYMSHGAKLAERFSKLAKGHVGEHPELGTVLDPSSQSNSEWNFEGHDGGFIARGFGGVPTGRGGNLLVDDAFKTGEEAMNDDRRLKVGEQYKSDLSNRVEDYCWTIINGTRWHEDDLHGQVREAEPDEWYVVNIPAVAFDEADADGYAIDPDTKVRDPLMRKPGEAVCPAITTKAYYLKQKKLTPFWFDAQFMGKPAGVGGNMFKEFMYYKLGRSDENVSYYELFLGGDRTDYVYSKDCVRFGIVDLAISEKEAADYTVFGVYDLDPWGRLLTREIVREHVSGDRHDDFVRDTAQKWGCRIVGIEDVTFGTALIQNMLRDGGINIWPLKPDKKKEIRAIPAANLAKRKLLFVDRDAEWRPAYESELKKFPRDKHDDQVDVTSYAVWMLGLLATNPIPDSGEHESYTFDDFITEMTRIKVESPNTSGMVIHNG